MGFDSIDKQFRSKRVVLECERCGATDGVQTEASRTHYAFDGEAGSPDDPNRPMALCRGCAAEHHAYWDERWSDIGH